MGRRISTILVASLVAGACGDAPFGPDSPVTGDWRGAATGMDLVVSLTEDEDGAVTGQGTISGPSIVVGAGPTVFVTGTHTSTGVLLSISPEGFQPLVFTGVVSADGTRIVGEMNQSGAIKVPMTMTRQ